VSSTSDASAPSRTSTPLLSSLTSSVSITPALVSQVNSAAASNPTLANLLQLAAAGKASPDQLKSLGLLIQSLAGHQITSKSRSATPAPGSAQPETPPTSGIAAQSEHVASTASYAPSSQNVSQTYAGPPKEFDLVIEFHEASSDRWIFPRGPAVCERKNVGDIVISAVLPFPQRHFYSGTGLPGTGVMGSEKGGPNEAGVAPQIVTFLLRKASLAIWDTVLRWAGGEETMAKSHGVLAALVR
jgi:hypothetical protein